MSRAINILDVVYPAEVACLPNEDSKATMHVDQLTDAIELTEECGNELWYDKNGFLVHVFDIGGYEWRVERDDQGNKTFGYTNTGTLLWFFEDRNMFTIFPNQNTIYSKPSRIVRHL